MPATKIHCDFYEIYGLDWTKVEEKTAQQFVRQIETMKLLGQEPDLCGFVGTATIGTVIGGFFAIQYQKELLHYDAQKHLSKEIGIPFERLFVVLFAQTGKLVLQNRKFVDLPLNMYMATQRFTQALKDALRHNNVEPLLTLYPSEAEVSADIFRSEFRKSSRVARLRVEKPDPNRIPQDFVYYNPEVNRNSIIRESRVHDYPSFRYVDFEALPNYDLKPTHMARDLIESGVPTLMKYTVEGRESTLKRHLPKKFEIYVDVDVEVLEQKSLIEIVDRLRTDTGLPVDIPTEPRETAQRSLFDYFGEENDEESENR